MLRLYRTNLKKDGSNIELHGKPLAMDQNIWENSRNMWKKRGRHRNDSIWLIPIEDENGTLIAYGYHDHEANRELRMLEELKKNRYALQFGDIFPEYKEVILCGCNELAVSFAEYLKGQGLVVSLVGKYWDAFGYKRDDGIDLDGDGKLIIYAEGIFPQNGDLRQTLKRSVSPEFEYIDKIYEANVLGGRIQDTIGDFSALVKRLKNEREIIILGEDREAQDVYDLLLEHGIDIYGFVGERGCKGRLLGKPVLDEADAVNGLQNPVFIDYVHTNGALGTEQTEFFDYCGYKRNEQFFMLRDYTDIPTSNLIHVLYGKRVLLAGDQRLCGLLTDYLYAVEEGEISVGYADSIQEAVVKEDEVLCLVIPAYRNGVKELDERRKIALKDIRTDKAGIDYTEYFISSRSFVLVDKYLNGSSDKYNNPKLTPKGILLGRIPGWSGNFFLRGIMDGHPEILVIPYSDLNNNLFYYCVRLAGLTSDKILENFWRMYDEEACSRGIYFPDLKRFEASVNRMLRMKERFTSQELFVLFHIACAEMLSGRRIEDVSKLVIYWEPHFISRNEFPFFAVWLEDKKINGKTIVLRRNNIVRTGSGCSRAEAGHAATNVMFLNENGFDGVNLTYQHWIEFKMRFEDIKLHPKAMLMKLCETIGIHWSDSMLHTTCAGKPSVYRGSASFDLKSVFNLYEDFLSEFDRFRISIASSPYQKRYGFPYENCLKFSRRELQELFLKPFMFEEKKIFKSRRSDDLKNYAKMGWLLWNVRKRMVLDDITPEFDRIELEQTGKEVIEEYYRKNIEDAIKYIREQDKLILYGTGNDCERLMGYLDESEKTRILYSDKRAEIQSYVYAGKKVIAPKELCSIYNDYSILVTSSRYRAEIKKEFSAMGIVPDRVFYNKAEFGQF